MSKNLLRRELRKARLFMKQRELIRASEINSRRFNLHERVRVQAERVVKAIDQNMGRYA